MGEWRHLPWHPSKYAAEREGMWKTIAKALLLAAFAGGILMSNFMGIEKTADIGILNNYFMEKFKYAGINGQNLFFYIFGERTPFLVLMLLLSFSSLGIAAGMAVLAWQGFSIGFMLSTGVAKYGAKGILLILGGLFPQYLIYLPVYAACLGFSVFFRKRISCCGKNTGTVEREYIRLYGIGIGLAVLMLLVFIGGIFLESYINPVILKKILKIF